MAKQYYSTGGGGRFYIYPVKKKSPSNDEWNIDTSPSKSSFGVISRAADRVGVFDTSINVSQTPQTIVFKIDRFDSAALTFINQYNYALAPGQYSIQSGTSGGGATNKVYEDSQETNPEAGDTASLPDSYKFFGIYVGAPIADALGSTQASQELYTKREFVFGLFSLASSSGDINHTNEDNKLTITLQALSEDIPFRLTNLDELSQPANIDDVTTNDNHGTSYIPSASWAAQFGGLTTTDVVVPAKTGLIIKVADKTA